LIDKWKAEDTKLLRTTDRVDYDVESFAQSLSTVLDKRIGYLTALRGEFRFVYRILLSECF